MQFNLARMLKNQDVFVKLFIWPRLAGEVKYFQKIEAGPDI